MGYAYVMNSALNPVSPRFSPPSPPTYDPAPPSTDALIQGRSLTPGGTNHLSLDPLKFGDSLSWSTEKREHRNFSGGGSQNAVKRDSVFTDKNRQSLLFMLTVPCEVQLYL